MAGKKAAKKAAPKPRRVRGTGSVFYHESRAVWVGRRPVGQTARGRTRYVEVSAPTQAACVAKLAAASPPGPTTTVKQWATRWLEGLTVRPLTLDGYTFCVNKRIVPALGHLRILALTAHQCEEAARRWSSAGLGPGTVRTTLQCLRTCLGAAVRAGVIPANPAASARKPKPPAGQIRTFTPDELAAVVADASDRPPDRMIALLAAAGLRIGEAIALDVGDFDPATGLLSITKGHNRHHGTGPPKSKHSTRTIRVPAVAVPALVAAQAGRATGPLFTSSAAGKRRGRESVRESWGKLLKRLGLAYRNIHQLRHSVGTAAISAGVPLGDVAKFLGDSVQTVVGTYLHPSGADPADALDRLFKTASMGKA